MTQTFIIAPRRMLEADLPAHAIDGELIITTDSGKLFQGQGPTTALKQVGGGTLPTGSGNEVLASPADGSSAPVAPRILVVADIPALPYDASGAASTAQSTAETFATSAVATEATARATADTTLQSNITAEATARVAADALKADLVGGVIPNAQLPPLAITVPFVVSSQAAMLALAASQGDVAIRTDVNQNFMLMSGGDPTVLADWLELLTPAAPVQSVNGYTGTVLLSQSDVGLANVNNTSDASKPVSTAQQTALNLKANTSSLSAVATSGAYSDLTGLPTIPSSFAWNVEANATGNLSLSNAGFSSTFNQTSAVAWLWANTTTGTNSTTNASPLLELAANYNSGTSGSPISSPDVWTIGTTLSAGVNGQSLLVLGHSGSTGAGAAGTATPIGVSIPSAYLDFASGANVSFSSSHNGVSYRFQSQASGGLNLGVSPSGAPGGVGYECVNQGYGHVFVGNWVGQAGGAILDVGNISTLTGITGTFIGLDIGANSNDPLIYAPVGTSSANFYGIQIAPTINVGAGVSWTGKCTMLLVNPTITATGSGPVVVNLMDLQVGGSSKLSVDQSGNLISAGTLRTPQVNTETSGGTFGVILSTSVGVALCNGLELTFNNANNGSADASISRLAAASLAVGNGTNGNTSGQITATTHTVAASASAPTSAGTAGTVGQIIAHGGVLYFCSATGTAGSATWNSLNLTAV